MRIALTTLTLIVAFALFFSQPTGTSPLPATRDSELALSKTSVFDVPSPDSVIENTSEPGESAPLPGAYQGAPSVIPHSIAGFIPIMFDNNPCIDCHQVEEKVEGEPTPIPESHFVDFRNDPGVIREDVAGARFICVSCHVPTTLTDPLVPNSFRP